MGKKAVQLRSQKLEPSRREQKREQTREALMEAAAVIIAEQGFAAATLVRITERANIALGTFYNYFESTDALFAELMDSYGSRLRSSIKASVPANAGFFEREEAAFRAWFKFLHQHPFFVRVLNEAEIFSPDAFERYFESITGGYRRILKHSASTGEIRKLKGHEIEAVALMLMAQRSFYGLRLKSYVSSNGEIDARIVAIYNDILHRTLAAE
ncbi:MAG: TetR/AcrR family transcriptional regulator [Rhizobiales bacterium]|nr:TetR/AcrR family transcriptional regulator [Hyphomicrobiales bacterium]